MAAVRQKITLDARRFGLIFFNSDSCHRAIASWDGGVQPTTTGQIEKFWLEFLSEPSEWWDCRLEKVSPKYLDFKHKKKTYKAFWRWKPPWVEAEMATYKSLLQKCTYNKNLIEGRKVHLHIIESGVKPSISLLNAILNMYCKCGSLTEGRKVFDATPEKDIVTWTLMLVAYASHGLNDEGFKLYKQVRDEGIRCDRIMYTSIVSICASLGDLEKAKAVHTDIISSYIETDAMLENNLVHMYARCGSMELARDVFHKMVERNVVSWNAMIAGSAQNGNAEETFHLFQQMQLESIQPDHITFISLLNACTSPATYKQGQWVHANILNTGLDADVRVGTALISMFVKCGRTHDARQVFDKMKVRDVVSWTAMINGYADHGPYGKAMELFREMEHIGVAPNTVTFIGLLKACANQASLQEAQWVHASIVAAALESDLRVRNGLIDMYAKCGSLKDAFSIFSTMSEKDVVTWSAMIVGFGQHGHGRAALQHFDQMISEGVHPNSVTFVGVLSACSHAGLVVEGLRCFHSMFKDHGISPALDHFGCVVDLLGRAGHLHEAEDFLNKMPQTPGGSTWGPLLGACRLHGNVELAERSAQILFELEPQNGAVYVLLSHVYARAGLWDKATSLRKLMEGCGLKKEPGCSWIGVGGKTHTFVVGDSSHPHIAKVHSELDNLSKEMEEAGYVPDTQWVMHDVDEHKKKELLCHHSEKLAIAYGLISTPPDTVIHIRKNLRICGDCHTATKLISKLRGREIVARDANRFHHFKDGVCSCGDYF